MRGGREAHRLDAPAEGQGAAQLDHCHVEVGRVGVVEGVRDDPGHAGPHGAGLRATEEVCAGVGHPLGGVLEPAGQTNVALRPSQAHPGANVTGAPQNPVLETDDILMQHCQKSKHAKKKKFSVLNKDRIQVHNVEGTPKCSRGDESRFHAMTHMETKAKPPTNKAPTLHINMGSNPASWTRLPSPE